MHNRQHSAGNSIADEKGQSDGEDEDCDDEEGRQKIELQHLRRLSEVMLKGHSAATMHLIPLEHHLQLLKALSGYLLQGRDKVLHPDEEVMSASHPQHVIHSFMQWYAFEHSTDRYSLHVKACREMDVT